MSPFSIVDVPDIEAIPAVAGEREARILAMIASSTITNARVQSLDIDRRKYQVVLEGILESEVEPSDSRIDPQELEAGAHEDDDSVATGDVSRMDDPEVDSASIVPNFVVEEPAAETVEPGVGGLPAVPTAEPRPFYI